MSFEKQTPAVETEAINTENVLKEELSVVELEERLEMAASVEGDIIVNC